jgi:hypothetical protein
MFFQPRALFSLDGIRVHFGRPVIVNNWLWRGDFQFRGFRPVTCQTGAEYSQHRMGNAFDLDVQGIPAEEVRQEILKRKDDVLFHFIMCLEAGTNWVHFDCRNILQRIKVVNP